MRKYLFSARELARISGGVWKNGSCGVSGVFTDTRKTGTGELFAALAGERFDAHDFLEKAVAAGAAALCVRKNAAVPENIPVLEVDDTLAAYQALGRALRERCAETRICAVTGSVGKTSVKEMLRAIFLAACRGRKSQVAATEGNTNNHIGVPQNLLKFKKTLKYAALELGSSAPGEISLLTHLVLPQAAIVNSIAPCHIENFLTLAGVAKEKGSIFEALQPGGTAVIPYGLAETPILADAAGNRKKLFFGNSPECDVYSVYLGGNIHGSSFELHFPDKSSYVVSWALSGKHQAVNAAAAAAAAWSFGIAPEVIVSGLPKTTLPGMRCKITRYRGATFINDAYNANPASMHAAFDYLKEFSDPAKLVLVLGGMRELGSGSEDFHEQLLKDAMEYFPGVRIIAIGKEFTRLPENGGIRSFETPESARSAVLEVIGCGDIVLAKGSRGSAVELALPEEAR